MPQYQVISLSPSVRAAAARRLQLPMPMPHAAALAAAAMAEASCCSCDDARATVASAASEDLEACLDAIMELEQARARCCAAAAYASQRLAAVGLQADGVARNVRAAAAGISRRRHRGAAG